MQWREHASQRTLKVVEMLERQCRTGRETTNLPSCLTNAGEGVKDG